MEDSILLCTWIRLSSNKVHANKEGNKYFCSNPRKTRIMISRNGQLEYEVYSIWECGQWVIDKETHIHVICQCLTYAKLWLQTPSSYEFQSSLGNLTCLSVNLGCSRPTQLVRISHSRQSSTFQTWHTMCYFGNVCYNSCCTCYIERKISMCWQC